MDNGLLLVAVEVRWWGLVLLKSSIDVGDVSLESDCIATYLEEIGF